MNKIPLKEQEQLLEICINNNINLDALLKQKNLSYEELRYINNETFNIKQNDIKCLDNLTKPNPIAPAVSFFSGAGGLNIGFEYAGFDNLVSIEYNEIFCNTLRLNYPNKVVIGPPNCSGDLRDRERISKELEKIIGKAPFEGVFHGGPPCQPFSIAANQRFSKNSENFKRQGFSDGEKGGLIFDYLWYIEKFLPKAFLIENVSGIIDCDDNGKIESALNNLTSLGYKVYPPKIINAAFYGVPQNRMRCLIIGTRSDKDFIFPSQDTTPSPCAYVFNKPIDKIQNHDTRKHTAAAIKRYMTLDYGCRDKLGRVDRLDPRQPSKTVIAGGTKGGGRSHLHPYIPRTLSVRECARLQTFPDNYIFTGASARQFTQVGNAVPPLLAYKIALAIKKLF